MKKIVCCFLIISSHLIGQNFPAFKVNKDSTYKSKSLVFDQLRKEYDTFVSYYTNLDYPTPRYITYYILAFKNGKWEQFSLQAELNRTNGQLEKLTRKQLNFNKASVGEVLNYWEKEGLWTFEDDSINCREKVLPNGQRVSSMVSDEFYEIVEVSDKNQYYVLNVYAPQYYQEVLFVKQREQFLNCIKRYKELFNK